MHATDAPGCHACDADPLFQWTRLANPREAAEQRREIAVLQGRVLSGEEITARYGPLRVAVTGCAVHHLGDDPADADSGIDRRALMHDAGCAGHGACRCEHPDPSSSPAEV